MQLTLADILKKHFPSSAYTVLSNTINEYKFSFKATRNRTSKLGDFRVREGQIATLTVNGTLNPYSFLITFLHELAHLAVYEQFGRNHKPHGYEWKSQFQEFLLLTIKHNLFPDELLKEVLLFTNNPKASTSASPALMKALAKFDKNSTAEPILYLDDITIGETFIFRNQLYKKIEKRRTRILCERLVDNRRYTISGQAEVLNN
jgi:SprT protein